MGTSGIPEDVQGAVRNQGELHCLQLPASAAWVALLPMVLDLGGPAGSVLSHLHPARCLVVACKSQAVSGQPSKECCWVPWPAPAPTQQGSARCLLAVAPQHCWRCLGFSVAVCRIQCSALWLQVEATGTTPCSGRWTVFLLPALEMHVCDGNSLCSNRHHLWATSGSAMP